MKKINLIIFISMIFSAQSSFKVEGMMCQANCANKVKATTVSLDGVNSCDVSFEEGLMTVDYNDGELTANQIVAQLNHYFLSSEAPYTFTAVDLASNTHTNTQCAKSCCKNKQEEKQSLFKRFFSWF